MLCVIWNNIIKSIVSMHQFDALDSQLHSEQWSVQFSSISRRMKATVIASSNTVTFYTKESKRIGKFFKTSWIFCKYLFIIIIESFKKFRFYWKKKCVLRLNKYNLDSWKKYWNINVNSYFINEKAFVTPFFSCKSY